MAVQPTERTVSPRKAPSRIPRLSPGAIGGIFFFVALGGLLSWGIKSGICEQQLSTWVALTVTGLRLGSIYAMIALGYTMVYGVLQLLNFAHSEIFMVGSFAGLYALSSLFGLDQTSHPNGVGGVELVLVLTGAILIGALASGGTAVLMERVAYRPLRRKGATRLSLPDHGHRCVVVPGQPLPAARRAEAPGPSLRLAADRRRRPGQLPTRHG